MTANLHEQAARAAKAAVLADYLAAAGVTAEQAEGIGVAGGTIVAQLASRAEGRVVRPPSAETWRLVVDRLRAGEKAREWARTVGIARLAGQS